MNTDDSFDDALGQHEPKKISVKGGQGREGGDLVSVVVVGWHAFWISACVIGGLGLLAWALNALNGVWQ